MKKSILLYRKVVYNSLKMKFLVAEVRDWVGTKGFRYNKIQKGFLREKGIFPLSLWCFLHRKGETEPMYIGSQCGGNRGFLPLIILLLILLFCCNVSLADKTLIFNPDNVDILHYVWSGFDGNDTEIYYAKWDSKKWTDPEKLTDDSDNDSSPALALDKNNNPWIVWASEDGISTSIYSVYWDGNKWSIPSQVDEVDIYGDTSPVIIFDSENTALAAWCGSDGIDDDIYITRWQGKNWSSPEMVNSNDIYPDIEPALSIGNNGALLLVWCGYSAGKYQLFYSEQTGKRWTDERFLFSGSFPASFPNFLYEENKNPGLLLSSLGIQHKTTWDGSSWSDLAPSELLLPQDLFNKLDMDISGTGYIAWIERGTRKGLKIKPFPKKFITKDKSSILAGLMEILTPSAVAAVEESKYIAFGDSITEGYGSSGEGYPPRLERKLNDGIGPSTVVNEGVGGETTIDGVNRLDSVLNNHNAKYILILEGANDVTHQFSGETIIFNLSSMVDKSIAFGTTPFLSTQTPRIDGWSLHVERDINPAVVNMANEKGIKSVDQYTEMNEAKESYMVDHVHPNDTGYELMSQIWFNAINEVLNPPDSGDDSGCGAVPPLYPGNRNSLLNLFPIIIISAILLLIRRRLSIN